MRNYVGDQEALTVSEFEELARSAERYGTDDFQKLFLGEPDETHEQRAAREAVARDVLADLLREGEADEIAWLDALYAAQLLSVVPLGRLLGSQRTKRIGWAGKAA